MTQPPDDLRARARRVRAEFAGHDDIAALCDAVERQVEPPEDRDQDRVSVTAADLYGLVRAFAARYVGPSFSSWPVRWAVEKVFTDRGLPKPIWTAGDIQRQHVHAYYRTVDLSSRDIRFGGPVNLGFPPVATPGPELILWREGPQAAGTPEDLRDQMRQPEHLACPPGIRTVGVSVQRFTASPGKRAICSICGEDLLSATCSHIPGQTYRVKRVSCGLITEEPVVCAISDTPETGPEDPA